VAAEDVQLVLDEARAGMERSLESLRHDTGRVRTGRASPSVLEGVVVEYYGAATPLQQLATVNVADARLLTVQPFDPSALDEIERAILKADLGLSPMNDGKILRIPIPELTEERRREFVKQVKKMAEDHKVGVRGARRDAIAMLKELEKDKEISEDDSRRAQKSVQDLTDEFNAKVDELAAHKEREILHI
jgi:ribosome recycling factor